jgi:D-xylose transport system substrate-binding protein
MKLLALLAALGLLAAACGDSDDDAESDTDTEAADDSESSDDEDEAAADDEADEDSDEAAAAAGEGKIAVLLPDSSSSPRWENDDRRFFEQAFTDAGLSEDQYLILNAEGDAATQQTQAEQAITDGATVLLIVNLDSGSAAAIIDNARDQGVAVIDYDRLTIEGPGADYYVSFDNVAVGRLMGEAMVEALADFDGTPNLVVLDGSPTDNNATLFAEGYMGVVQEKFDSGDWNLVDHQAVPDWDNIQAQTIFEQILTASGSEVDGVIVANDGMAGGVIAALKSQNLNGIPVTGQDATVGGIQNILAGDQYMTVYKQVEAEASAAAELALALFNGETPEVDDAIDNGTNDVPAVLLEPLTVTTDNITDTVIADGFRTVEEICVGEFADTEFCSGS